MKNGLKATLILLVTAVLSVGSVHAQDPQYTQFYSNQLMLNPAFAGAALGPRVVLNYRNQWATIPGSFRQFAASYDAPLQFGKSLQGWGVYIQNDVAGEGNLNKLDLVANYSIAVPLRASYHKNQHYLRLGVGGGVQQASLDFFKLRFGDQIDPRDGFVNQTQEIVPTNLTDYRVDFNTGAAYYNKYAFASFSVHHLTEPTQSFIDETLPPDSVKVDASLPRRYTFTGGVNLEAGPRNDPESVLITPVVRYRQQREFTQIDAGTYVTIKPIVFGLWYRHQDAVAALVGYKEGIFSIGYSYDYTISTLRNANTGGSHEIAIVMEFEREKKTTFKHRDVPCPRF